MTFLMKNKTNDFQEFLLRHIQKKLSGTSVITIEEVIRISHSVQFVLEHGNSIGSIENQFFIGKKNIFIELKELEKEIKVIKKLNVLGPARAYQSTLDELEKFIKTYDIDYNAREMGEAWLDYQLAHSIDDQIFQGIDYISEYIERLKKESLFISKLPLDTVKEILDIYERSTLVDYRIDVNNLYEVLFNQVVIKWLLGPKGSQSACLSKEERDYLMNQKEYQLPPEMANFISAEPYYETSYQKLVSTLNQNLSGVILLKETVETSELILVEPLLEKEYKDLVLGLDGLSNQEIIQKVTTEVESPYDLDEIMKLFYFEEKEWLSFFQQLPLNVIFSYLCLLKKRNNGEITTVDDYFKVEVEEDYLKGLKSYLMHIEEKFKIQINEELKYSHIESEEIEFY
ncbi:DUF6179 domain-containing protein [Vagococcus sp.]|uniref:DUF6179 domain-containing protein n=1 Tax=Vagococcus sp. TaxID=1933889 RepID=UPI002FCBA030